MSHVGPRPRPPVPLIFALALALPACREKPKELDTPVATAGTAPAIAPLSYEVPGTWTKLGEAQSGSKRASYKIPRAGADSEDAELTVLFFGTGSPGDADKHFREWLGQFDGNGWDSAARKTLESPAGKVDTAELLGTYKVSLGPPVGPRKQSPMSMVKEKWRLYAAVVRTRDRGNWFFKLVGPDETVLAAKNALETALQSAR